MNQQLRIACLGPSGSGKTTIATWVAEEYQIPFIPNSAGLVIPERQKDYLRSTYRWKENGHAEVIRLSNEFPSFGQTFQKNLLEARGRIIQGNDNFIIDRSPIDNVAYMLSQCSHLAPEDWIKSFIQEAQEYAKSITHFLVFPSFAEDIEVNGSRVANKYFQRMSTAVFEHAYLTYFKQIMHDKTLILDTWDLDEKQRMIRAFLFEN